MSLVGYSSALGLQRGSLPSDETFAGTIGSVYVPADFDTKEKAFSGAKVAEKGLK